MGMGHRREIDGELESGGKVGGTAEETSTAPTLASLGNPRTDRRGRKPEPAVSKLLHGFSA